MTLRLLAAALLSLLALVPLRAEPIDVGFQGAEIDLLPRAEVVREFSSRATIELPAVAGAPRRTMVLNGQGPGPLYRWAVFTLHNPGAEPRELVIAAPHQRFVASRVLWPRPEGSRVLGLAAADGHPVTPLASLGGDAYAITVPPGAMISYVLEVSATGLDSLSLWHRGAFHVVSERYAFFRGLVLGISILLGIAFVCLFIVRPRAVFPAAALFGWSAIAFLVIELGYLPTVLGNFPALTGSEQQVRVVVEGLMLGGVIAMLATFLELRRWMPLVGMALVGGGAVAAALVLYGWVDPRPAIGLTRIAFAGVVAAGLVIIMMLWRRGSVRAQASLLGWVVLAGWTLAAALGALNLVAPALMHPMISAGLVLVLVTIGFTLAQLAFGLGLASSEEFEEAGRRALALAASDQAVWDWQVDQARLHVGPEIERALGVDEGACCDAAGWLDLVHPADRVAYGAAVEAAERRGRGSFSQEFRLRRADGDYRWYVLRARAMPGGNEGASRLIGTLSDVTGLRRSEDRLLADAVRDRLTGLPNRALFLDRLEQAIARARASAETGLHVIALDLDRFKSFNDGLGSEAGDYLLSTVGRRLQGCIGPADTLARLPGHQFGIIWHATPGAPGIAELTVAVGESVAQPIHLPAGEVVITASMGVALVQHEDHRAEAVLKDAEIALYEAKRHGYGAVEYFRPDMREERSALLQLEQNLRRALERNEIEVVYQPIIRLADRKLAGFEALMRWRRGGLILEPDSFVGLAEETGIIRELGRYVLKEATSRLGVWQRAFRPQEPLFVAVNISSVQLLNGDLVDDIQALIEREDLRPGTLKLELTESLVVENPELAHKLLTRLKQLGVALSCDDFGTGYSGLESVFRLPFDTVKIDRCFLEGESGDRNWIMVGAMLRLARDLGLEVVAEGIETEGQMEQLGRLGCDYGQGYLIGPPVSAQKVVAALGGLTYGAKGPGSGLAAFWSRLTTPRAAERPAERPAEAQQPPTPRPVEKPPAADPVIDVRRLIMPAPSRPSAPPVPEVGAAPFAPRQVKVPEFKLSELKLANVEPPEDTLPEATPPEATPPETTPPETTPPETTPPEVKPPEATPPETTPPEVTPPEVTPPEDTWSAPSQPDDSPAPPPSRVAAEEIHIPMLEPATYSVPAALAHDNGQASDRPEAKTEKPQEWRKASRGAKSSPIKSGPIKSGPAKSRPAKTRPAKARSAKSGSRRAKAGAKRVPAKQR